MSRAARSPNLPSGFEFNAERIVARAQGREGWVREARRQLEQRRWQASHPVPRGRVDRLLLAAERMEDDLDAQLAGNGPMRSTAPPAVTPRGGIWVADQMRGSRHRCRTRW